MPPVLEWNLTSLLEHAKLVHDIDDFGFSLPMIQVILCSVIIKKIDLVLQNTALEVNLIRFNPEDGKPRQPTVRALQRLHELFRVTNHLRGVTKQVNDALKSHEARAIQEVAAASQYLWNGGLDEPD